MELLSPRPGIRQIKPYRSARPPRDGRSWIDLSLTENPLGPSPAALNAYRHAAGQIHRYPDWSQDQLRHAIAARHGIDPNHVICSAGSEELIHLVTQAFAGPGDEVLCHEHGYRGFLRAIRAAGATAVVAAERDMVVDVEAMIDRANDRTRICFLANPNNPTGTYIPAEAVLRLRAGLPPHTLLVLDSAYAEYCRRSNYSDGTEIVENADNVLMVRTFSKMHGLAGLRVGWGYGPASVIDALNAIRGAFNVSVAAQAAASAAIADTDHEEASYAHNAEWLPWLSRELEHVGLRVYPSVCNFVLAQVPADPSLGVQTILDHLAARSILVKPVADYGLANCLRITVGQEEENRALIAALAEVLG
ncbi:histidinol-phosphate transaminase [Azospirillum thermophilum]|uniref:Histidinol-phosphate aminotransferase n=1 Tax=Azospirillum thermophilum TaxID=2202148 RepID=A0A2S2CRD4_9PROT|nr:histidinol-phosphate transaminase [Azospirillum thermophilum]AWK87019.1 histidinol-phosphate transaminase [Azospirillum thermophilum]